MKMPLKEDANVVKYTYPTDPKYLILPYELYQAIWSKSVDDKFKYKETLFDCAYLLPPPVLSAQTKHQQWVINLGSLQAMTLPLFTRPPLLGLAINGCRKPTLGYVSPPSIAVGSQLTT
jgi:hypothetical protein